MIIKCQRSLETNEPVPQLLLYNRHKTRIVQCDMPPDWDRRFGPSHSPEDNRFFALVQWWDRKRMPTFVRRVPEQGW